MGGSRKEILRISNLSVNGNLEDNEDLDNNLLMSYSIEDQVQLWSKFLNRIYWCKVQLSQLILLTTHFQMHIVYQAISS